MAAEAATISYTLDFSNGAKKDPGIDFVPDIPSSTPQVQLEHLQKAVASLLRAQHVYRLEVEKRWDAMHAESLKVESELCHLQSTKAHPMEVHVSSFGLPGRQTTPSSADGWTEPKRLPINYSFGSEAKAQSGCQACGVTGERRQQNHWGTRTITLKAEEDVFRQIETQKSREWMLLTHPCQWRQWLESEKFDMFMGVIIVMNMVVMICRVQYDGVMVHPSGTRERSSTVENTLEVTEQIFTILFFVELILRLFLHGPKYLKSIMNFLDTTVVVVSCMEMWFFTSGNGHISILRIFRLLRLMKVVRVVRVMNAFKPLRVLVNAVTNSIGALWWSMTLLFVLEMIGAILLAQTLKPAIEDETRDMSQREDLWGKFGTMLRAWLTLFEITMAPGGFVLHRNLYDDVHPLFSFAIALYVCFVTFAVTRVITAMFLKETLKASENDTKHFDERAQTLKEKSFREMCQGILPDQANGTEGGQDRIDEAGLETLLSYRRVNDWLEELDIQKDDAELLFRALEDEDGSVALHEFFEALSQMSRNSKGREVILQFVSYKVLERLSRLQSLLQQKAIMQGHLSPDGVDINTCQAADFASYHNASATSGQSAALSRRMWTVAAGLLPCGKNPTDRIAER